MQNLSSATKNVNRNRANDIKSAYKDDAPESTSPAAIKEQSFYDKNDKAAPDNNPFFTAKSNPLSSKGN